MEEDLEHKLLMMNKAKGKAEMVIGSISSLLGIATLAGTGICSGISRVAGGAQSENTYVRYAIENRNALFVGGAVALGFGLSSYLFGRIKHWWYNK